MEVRLLGPVQLLVDGRSVAVPAAKQRALLALLALHAGEVVAADRVVDELWGERPPPTAHKLVQTYVWQLRKLLGEALRTRAPGYELAITPEQLDRGRFEDLLARGQEELTAGDAERAAETLTDALALWRGVALCDVELHGFARQEAESLELQRVAAQEARIDAELALGRDAELIAELEGLVAAHPYRETPRAQLMLALYRCGRQAEALDAYTQTRRRLHQDLGLEPTPRLQELQQAILRHDASLAPTPSQPAALPVPATRLIGRARELSNLQRLLRRRDVRLVTVTGAGGSGKTRLALEAAAQLASEFEHGAFFVDLAPLADPSLLVAALAQGIGVRERADQPLTETLTRFLADKQALILLDNFEHLLAAAADVATVLATAPRLKLLVTTRARLRLSGEWELPLAPLDEADAVELFTARAQQASIDFQPDDTIALICRRIDCLPLAIELAAPQLRVISTDQLLDRLEHRLAALGHGPTDLPSRQQTLRTTLDWSYNLLPDADQNLLARLSVFAGGFTARAAAAVAEASFEGLATLLEYNLLRRQGERFSMLETIREYALERLDDLDDGDELHTQHAEYFLELAEEATPELKGPRQAWWFDRLEADHDNLRAALAWSIGRNVTQALRLTIALWSFWRSRSYLSEARRWLDAALAQHAKHEPQLRARALEAASDLTGSQGDFERALLLADESGTLYRQIRDERRLARALVLQGWWALCMHDHARANLLFEQSRALSSEEGQTWDRVGALALYEERYADAKLFFEKSLAAFETEANARGAAQAVFGLGLVALAEGRMEEAAANFRQSLEALRDLGDGGWGISYRLEGLAAVAVGADPAVAARLLAKAEALRQDIHHPLDRFEEDTHQRTLRLVHERLDERALELAWTEGTSMTLDETIVLALRPATSHPGE
jgi:predicted ATPase/DNA-binding SARP family transcriptional activator